MVRLPRRTTSKRPFVISRTSSGDSKRFRTTSCMEVLLARAKRRAARQAFTPGLACPLADEAHLPRSRRGARAGARAVGAVRRLAGAEVLPEPPRADRQGRRAAPLRRGRPREEGHALPL